MGWQLFLVFAKIGAFTLGGGYAMLPLIQKEIVERKQWISSEEFVDMIAVVQSMPGILAVNIAILTGYRIKGNLGSILAATGAILPSFLIMLVIAMFFRNFQDNLYVAKVFKAVRPVVVALLAVAVFTTARAIGLHWKLVAIPIVATLLIAVWGVSPVWIVVAAALGGLLFYAKK